MVKKRFVLSVLLLILLIIVVSCNSETNQPIPSEPTPTAGETVTPVPEATPGEFSAVGYLGKSSVISNKPGLSTVSDPKNLAPGQYCVCKTPNYPDLRYEILLLNKDQSKAVLSASDLTSISYRQSECLPLMLDWDDVSVIDVYSYLYDNSSAYKAFCYYLENSTVIIVNDAARKADAYKNNTSAWIVSVPKGEEGSYPFEIPPKGTVITPDSANKSEYEQFYDSLRTYFMKDDAFVPVLLPPTVYEDYMKDYRQWIDWRLANPEEYAAWKELSVPQKKLSNYSGPGLFRIPDFSWCEYYRDENKSYDSAELSRDDLPRLYCEIRQYEIPKEEMLEFVKWMSWSGYFESSYLTFDDVETLYSNDEDQIRQCFKNPDVLYYNGELYPLNTIITTVPAYNIAQMFTQRSFEEFTEGFSISDYVLRGQITADRYRDINAAWVIYANTTKQDTGVLNAESALRVLNGFMDIYRELRYSPDVLAAEPVWRYNENFLEGEYGPYFHLSRKTLDTLSIEMYSVLAKETADSLAYLLDPKTDYSSQFAYYPWEGELTTDIMVSVNPAFYNGPIALFDFEYKLDDHIEIVNSDGEHAEVSITARSRDGEKTLTYNALFSKIGGIWYISGGTVVDLLKIN